jgi:anti-anti-sigma regulatory factor
MLRIVRNQLDAHHVVLGLQGQIVREWAELLERECVELGRAGVRIALDLSEAVLIDRAGFEVLSRLSRAGVGIIACPPLIAEALREQGIAARPTFGKAVAT